MISYRSYGSRGMTLVELLVVAVIVGVFSSVFIFNYSCVTKDVYYSETQVEMGQVHRSLNMYYKRKNEMPLGSTVSLDDLSEVGSLKETMQRKWDIEASSIDKLFSSGSVYEILPGSLNVEGNYGDDVVSKYVVVYVSDDEKDPELETLRKVNGTLFAKDSIRSCDDDVLVVKLGNVSDGGLSDSLKFDVNESYTTCPNKALCDRLN